MKIYPKHRQHISELIGGAVDVQELQRAYHISERDAWFLRNHMSTIHETVVKMQRILALAESAQTGWFFNNDWLNPPEREYHIKHWSFICNLSYDYPHVFYDCDDNHEVSDLLVRERVVGKNDESDPEMSCSYFYFKTKRNAEAFIARLNKFCQKRLRRKVA